MARSQAYRIREHDGGKKLRKYQNAVESRVRISIGGYPKSRLAAETRNRDDQDEGEI